MPRWIPICLVLLPVIAAGGPAAKDDEAITGNLLPYQIIEGHEPYTLAERMAHYRVPGVGIAVIENQEVVWTGFYGEKGDGDPVTAETLFCMGSLSKAVASACVLGLARDGLIDVDGDVNGQLRSWRLPDHPWSATAPVTPALLMNHSGGLPHRPPYVYAPDRIPTAIQMVQGEPPSRSTPLLVTAEPGRAFQYSNGGFTVLQILTEDITGLPYSQALERRVFMPLGIARATFAAPLPADRLRNAAHGHGPDGSLYRDTRVYMAHAAAGGLWTTAPDYARFLIEIQKAAAGRSDRLMDPDQARRMISPGPAARYGLGVFLYEANGEQPFFSHIGDGGGFVAGFTAHRTDGYGAVVTTNGVGGINLCREVLRSVAKVYRWPDYLPPARREIPLDADELARLEGRYLAGFDRIVRLENGGDRLLITGEGLSGFTVYRVAPDTLVVTERSGEIVVDETGAAPVLHLRLSDPIGRAADEATPATRLADGELSPLERLLETEAPGAFTAYLELAGREPDHAALAESRFNRMGYRQLAAERLDAALRVFELNTLLHPDSGNVHDSYGEALLAAGRREEALASYRRSLALDPGNSNAERVLAELRGP